MSYAIRLVLDTNVLLSAIAFPASVPGKILSAWRQGAVEVVLSEFILEELRRVLPRLYHRHGLSEAEINELVDILSIQVDLIEPKPVADDQLRDPNDRPVLGTLLSALELSHANYLVTGDKDLLVLAERYPILSPAEFWAKHG